MEVQHKELELEQTLEIYPVQWWGTRPNKASQPSPFGSQYCSTRSCHGWQVFKGTKKLFIMDV